MEKKTTFQQDLEVTLETLEILRDIDPPLNAGDVDVLNQAHYTVQLHIEEQNGSINERKIHEEDDEHLPNAWVKPLVLDTFSLGIMILSDCALENCDKYIWETYSKVEF